MNPNLAIPDSPKKLIYLAKRFSNSLKSASTDKISKLANFLTPKLQDGTLFANHRILQIFGLTFHKGYHVYIAGRPPQLSADTEGISLLLDGHIYGIQWKGGKSC